MPQAPAPTNPRSRTLERLLEIYRRNEYRTTTSGRRVAWDEKGEADSAEIRRHNAFLAKKHQQKTDAKERLKKKGAVPTKDGKPIFEQPQGLDENIQQVLMSFRRQYQSNRPMRFREWIKVVAVMLNDLT